MIAFTCPASFSSSRSGNGHSEIGLKSPTRMPRFLAVLTAALAERAVMPYAKMEYEYLPSVDRVKEEVKKVMAYT